MPVVGVVEPGAPRGSRGRRSGRIGVIGTEGTVALRGPTSARFAGATAESVSRRPACPLFVPLAEEGWVDHPVTDLVAEHYLRPLLAGGIDALILGCTHYPLLRPSLERVVGPSLRLITRQPRWRQRVVTEHGGMMDTWFGEDGVVRLQLTDASDRFLGITRRILGRDPEHLEVVDLA